MCNFILDYFFTAPGAACTGTNVPVVSLSECQNAVKEFTDFYKDIRFAFEETNFKFPKGCYAPHFDVSGSIPDGPVRTVYFNRANGNPIGKVARSMCRKTGT